MRETTQKEKEKLTPATFDIAVNPEPELIRKKIKIKDKKNRTLFSYYKVILILI